MGEVNISIRILKGKSPILFSWLNSSTNAIEGCLVTCPCQGYNLQEEPHNRDAFDIELGKAMGKASILTLSSGIHFTSVVDQWELQELKDFESDKALPEPIRRSKRIMRGRYAKNGKSDEEEQNFEVVESESKADSSQVGGWIEEDEDAKNGKSDEEEQNFEVVESESKADSSQVGGWIEEDDTEPMTETVDVSESAQLLDATRTTTIEKSEVLESVSTENMKLSQFNDDNNFQPDDSTREPSSQQSGGLSEALVEGCTTSIIKQESVLDQFPQTVFQLAEVQHTANTVEVTVEEHSDFIIGLNSNNHQTEVISTDHSALNTTLTVPVTLRDGEEAKYLNMERIKVVPATSADDVVVSQGSGENNITVFTDNQTGTLSAELLKGRAGPTEIDPYTVKIIQGEVCGPLGKVDQVRMDKYVKFKEHKEAEFFRKYHKNQNTKGVRFVLCELCGAPLTNKNIKLHMAALHQAPEERLRNFGCNICEKSFLHQSDLKKHLDTHLHKRYKCQYCDKSYSQEYSRRLHEKEHFGEVKKKLRNPFALLEEKSDTGKPIGLKPNVYVTCEVCQKKLRPASLKGHISTHKNVYFTCEICGKVLRVSGKREHMFIHKGVKNHQCDVCEKRFATKRALDAHIRVHTRERPYKCKFCSECFRQSYTRRAHQRKHTGEKPYHCERCDRSWRDRTTYWGHMKKRHPGAPLMYFRKSLQIQAAMEAKALESVENTEKQMAEQSMMTDTSSMIEITLKVETD